MTPSPVASPEVGSPTVTITDIDVVGLFAITALVLIVVILIPWLVDIRQGYRARDRATAQLTELIKSANLKIDEAQLEPLAKQYFDSPTGIEGLGRMILALSLVAVVGLALLYLVLTDGSTGLDIAKGVLTALAGALTTIIGFYFGSRVGSGTTTTTTTGTPPAPTAPPEATAAETAR